MKYAAVFTSVLILIAGSGCQTLTKDGKTVLNQPATSPVSFNPISSMKKKLPSGKPDSIVAIWKDATYTVANQQPTRGFGGRLYFYDRDDNPVLVDGDLIVYGFNDSDYSPSRKPEKRFVFSREELQSHMSVSTVGPSYNVWLPWDHVNGEQRDVTIVAMFRGADGSICRGNPVPSLLPGTKPVYEQEQESLLKQVREATEGRRNGKRDGRIEKAGFNSNLPAGAKKVRTHEIRIPEGSRERLFGTVPESQYMLPKPAVRLPAANTNSNTEETEATASQPPEDSSLDQRQAQNPRFERQGLIPPGKQPPRLGGGSSPARQR